MNRTFKKFLFVAVVGVGALVSTSGFARGGDGEQRLERMAEKLELTDAQKAKSAKIFKDRKAQAEKIKQDPKLSYDEKSEKLRELRRGGKDEVAAVLTDAQKAEFRQMRERRGDRMEKRAEGFERMAEKLDLSAAQKQKIRQIMEDSREERAAILEANDGDRAEARPELKAHREKTRKEVRAVLTAEQQKKFDAMKAKHGRRGEKAGKGR